MSNIPFEKWDATGNDFVIVNLADSPLDEGQFTVELVTAICDRSSGVGADGVVLMETNRDSSDPTSVVIRNSDGSSAGMCGNALRCVAKILARSHGQSSHQVAIGDRLVRTQVMDPELPSVDMGAVEAQPGYDLFAGLRLLDDVLGQPGRLLSFGNPHYVVCCDEIPSNWAELGARAQPVAHQVLGVGGVNCGFLQTKVQTDGTRQLKVYERGAGVTKSCGSGACAASAVLASLEGVQPPHRFELPGGKLEVRGHSPTFELLGPAKLQFSGVWQAL